MNHAPNLFKVSSDLRSTCPHEWYKFRRDCCSRCYTCLFQFRLNCTQTLPTVMQLLVPDTIIGCDFGCTLHFKLFVDKHLFAPPSISLNPGVRRTKTRYIHSWSTELSHEHDIVVMHRCWSAGTCGIPPGISMKSKGAVRFDSCGQECRYAVEFVDNKEPSRRAPRVALKKRPQTQDLAAPDTRVVRD